MGFEEFFINTLKILASLSDEELINACAKAEIGPEKRKEMGNYINKVVEGAKNYE
ncbi:MAG: hypothetical protein ABS939_08235 [Psychrobacillus sp.]